MMDRWLRNPNVVRVVALALGVLLWFVVHMESQQAPAQTGWTGRSTSKEIEGVGIEVVGLDESRYELVAIEPSLVRVRVSGLPNVLNRVTTQTARVRLDLGAAVSGVQQMQLMPVGFPEQVEVEIFPSSVTVTIEEKLVREMPVTIDVTGEPAEGYVAGTPTATPNRVYVTYRESGIDDIAAVRGMVDVGGASGPVRKQIRLFAYNARGERMEAAIEPSVVDVEVPVTHPAVTLPLQISIAGEPAAGYSVAGVEQKPLEVAVYGEERVLGRLEFYAGGTVDVTGLAEDAAFSIPLPKIDGVSQLEPDTAQVKVRIVPSERRTFTGVKLNVSGVRAGFAAAVRDPREGVMAVTLEGAPDILNGLDAGDIDLIVDVSNLAEGVHQVDVTYGLPAFVRVVQDGAPPVVTVEIRPAAADETGANPGAPPAGDGTDGNGSGGNDSGGHPGAGEGTGAGGGNGGGPVAEQPGRDAGADGPEPDRMSDGGSYEI